MFKRILLATMLTALAAMGADADVEKAERSWGAGVVANDFAALNKVLADDLVYRHSNGLVDTKASYIDALKSGKSRYYSLDYEEIKIKTLDANTSLAFCKAKFVTKAADGSKQNMTLMLLHVFRKTATGWQLVAHQSARMPAQP